MARFKTIFRMGRTIWKNYARYAKINTQYDIYLNGDLVIMINVCRRRGPLCHTGTAHSVW